MTLTSDFIWSGEEATLWLDGVVLQLGFAMEDSAAVNSTNWSKFRIFTDNLLIVVWGSVGSTGEDALGCAAGLGHLALARPDHIWHDDWAFILLSH